MTTFSSIDGKQIQFVDVAESSYDDSKYIVTRTFNKGFQADDKIIQPSSHIHIVFTNALNFSIESGPVTIIIFTDGEQALEIISCLVKT